MSEEFTPTIKSRGVDPDLYVLVLRFLMKRYGKKEIRHEVYAAMIQSLATTEGLYAAAQEANP